MGLFEAAKRFVKSQLLDVIEWSDTTTNTMVYEFPMGDKEIMMGAKLTVRESQVAIFMNEGQIADIFGPGMHKLDTSNMPILTKIMSWPYGFNSPFKANVYFVNTKQFTDQKWGTANPVMMRDPDFGIIRVRAFGIYSFKVEDPAKFLREVFGTNSLFTVDGINEQLRKTIVSGLSDAIAESKIPALDMAASYDELGEYVRKKMDERFDVFGLTIPTLVIENISLPEEVERAMDQRAQVGALGDAMAGFTQYQAAQALRDAAQNEGGGLASAGVGLGAGVSLGQVMGGAFASQQPYGYPPQQGYPPHQGYPPQGQAHQQQATQKTAAAAAAATITCIECKAELPAGSKFCMNCGKSQAPEEKFCPNPECGKKVVGKFCMECGTKIE
ncbi:MAG: hypothetical protein GX362_01950 [Methanosarcinaceae archaeon]|nr:hypothetical protein [Methanosarcinaceae archaeon]